jgi:hypothetical protein
VLHTGWLSLLRSMLTLLRGDGMSFLKPKISIGYCYCWRSVQNSLLALGEMIYILSAHPVAW